MRGPLSIPASRLSGRPAASRSARPGFLDGTGSPARLALAALLAGTLALGFVGVGGFIRPVFVVGAAGVGYLAWREGAGRSVEAAIALFVFAPFLRRIVDARIGFDPSGFMLLGPVLAIALPTLELRTLLVARRPDDRMLAPLLLVFACVSYGMLISAFAGSFAEIATGMLKTYTPLLYGAWIMRKAREEPGLLRAAVNAFCVMTPIIGAYGVWQYVSPQDWDRYWMLMVSGTISVLGKPEPYQVRVFSMMNSPASFGTYAACGVLLFGFCRRGWLAVLCATVVSLGLVFTFYRTAWISLAVGVIYCGLFRRTRERAVLIGVAIVVVTMLAAGSADFGDAVMQRLETFTSSVADDGSGRARLDQLMAVYKSLDEMTFGWGFATLSKPFNGVDAADGEIVSALLSMGVPVGCLYLTGLLWAAVQALRCVGVRSDPPTIVAGAVTVGMILAIPLTSVTSGEIGLLFWVFIGILTGQREAAS